MAQLLVVPSSEVSSDYHETESINRKKSGFHQKTANHAVFGVKAVLQTTMPPNPAGEYHLLITTLSYVIFALPKAKQAG